MVQEGGIFHQSPPAPSTVERSPLRTPSQAAEPGFNALPESRQGGGRPHSRLQDIPKSRGWGWGHGRKGSPSRSCQPKSFDQWRPKARPFCRVDAIGARWFLGSPAPTHGHAAQDTCCQLPQSTFAKKRRGEKADRSRCPVVLQLAPWPLGRSSSGLLAAPGRHIQAFRMNKISVPERWVEGQGGQGCNGHPPDRASCVPKGSLAIC